MFDSKFAKEKTLLCKYGVEVFGDKEKFNSWLETDNSALGNIKPNQLLVTLLGLKKLKDELDRIEQGLLA